MTNALRTFGMHIKQENKYVFWETKKVDFYNKKKKTQNKQLYDYIAPHFTLFLYHIFIVLEEKRIWL